MMTGVTDDWPAGFRYGAVRCGAAEGRWLFILGISLSTGGAGRGMRSSFKGYAERKGKERVKVK
jgi:hypothetical protein